MGTSTSFWGRITNKVSMGDCIPHTIVVHLLTYIKLMKFSHKKQNLEALEKAKQNLSEEKQEFIKSKVSEGWIHINMVHIDLDLNPMGGVGEEFLISPQKKHLFQKNDDRWQFEGENIPFWWNPEDEDFDEEDFFLF